MSYKIIDIPSENSVLINYGFNDGAKKGDKLRIYQKGEDVIDPETGDYLGSLDLIKETLEVVIPYEQFSYCRKVNRSSYSLLSPLSQFEQIRKSYEPLEVLESDISGKKFPKKEPIKVGDLVDVLD